MTAKSEKYLETARALSDSSLTDKERTSIYAELNKIKKSFDGKDWDALIEWSNNPMIWSQLRKQKAEYMK